MGREDVENESSNQAFLAGKKFAKEHPFSEFAEDRDSARLMDHCPIHLRRFEDVFKYGCQSAWRRKGELPGMVAYDLEPGDVFTVENPDPESSLRICKINDAKHGIRFGWPGNEGYWCGMGSAVSVTLVSRKEENDAEQTQAKDA
jgi:hypothetical protein